MSKKHSNGSPWSGDPDDFDLLGGSRGGGYSTTKPVGGFKKCYHSHPLLELGGGKFMGASCLSPVLTDADVYLGFDRGMTLLPIRPWEAWNPVQLLHPIPDMKAPSDPAEFAKLVEWVCNQLQAGKVVHAGCIGGHGRTGTFLAALYKVLKDDKAAIDSVRADYCKSAVESKEQIAFLGKHFGIDPAAPAKTGFAWSPPTKNTPMQNFVDGVKTKQDQRSLWPKATGGAEVVKEVPKGWSKPNSGKNSFKDSSRTFQHAKVASIWEAVF